MKRRIKIRFVERWSIRFGKLVTYYIQKKTIFGWRDITYTQNMGVGLAVYYYSNEDKNKLLEDVLDNHFAVCMKHVSIVEYPSIKISS